MYIIDGLLCYQLNQSHIFINVHHFNFINKLTITSAYHLSVKITNETIEIVNMIHKYLFFFILKNKETVQDLVNCFMINVCKL